VEIIGLPGLYCLDGIKEKWEADCLSIRFNWQRANGEIYKVIKKYGALDTGYFVYFLKRDGYDDFFFENNFEITVKKNHIVISNFYGEGNSKKCNLYNCF
tara:strand:+ start:196 stop:495 length:300 start_codon:yes stop_codon:yes gene_type:complete